MKKILISLLAVMAIALPVLASDTYSRDASVLPAPARTVLKNSFKAGVSLVKIDKELFSTEYEAILTDGTEVKFDDKGNWKEVECPADKSVPASFVPAPIRNWMKTNHKGTHIIGIEKDRKGYEIKLSNGIEAKFNRQGAFKRYDD